MAQKIDITGQRFGKLVAIKDDGWRRKRTFWLCKCDCGNIKSIRLHDLRSGATISCGCARRGPYKHGHTMNGHDSPTYQTWMSMRNRCNNPNNNQYHNYGSRGIRICQEWNKSFDAFLRDMGEKPKGKSIDRIDNNGDYTPENCRWASIREQNRNRRDNVWLTAMGKTMIEKDWASFLGMSYYSLRGYRCRGHNIEDVIISRLAS